MQAAHPAGERGVSRRALLAGAALVGTGVAATAVGVEEGLLPGRSWLYRHFGPQGTPGVVPDVTPGRHARAEPERQPRLARTSRRQQRLDHRVSARRR